MQVCTYIIGDIGLAFCCICCFIHMYAFRKRLVQRVHIFPLPLCLRNQAGEQDTDAGKNPSFHIAMIKRNARLSRAFSIIKRLPFVFLLPIWLYHSRGSHVFRCGRMSEPTDHFLHNQIPIHTRWRAVRQTHRDAQNVVRLNAF